MDGYPQKKLDEEQVVPEQRIESGVFERETEPVTDGLTSESEHRVDLSHLGVAEVGPPDFTKRRVSSSPEDLRKTKVRRLTKELDDARLDHLQEVAKDPLIREKLEAVVSSDEKSRKYLGIVTFLAMRLQSQEKSLLDVTTHALETQAENHDLKLGQEQAIKSAVKEEKLKNKAVTKEAVADAEQKQQRLHINTLLLLSLAMRQQKQQANEMAELKAHSEGYEAGYEAAKTVYYDEAAQSAELKDVSNQLQIEREENEKLNTDKKAAQKQLEEFKSNYDSVINAIREEASKRVNTSVKEVKASYDTELELMRRAYAAQMERVLSENSKEPRGIWQAKKVFFLLGNRYAKEVDEALNRTDDESEKAEFVKRDSVQNYIDESLCYKDLTSLQLRDCLKSIRWGYANLMAAEHKYGSLHKGLLALEKQPKAKRALVFCAVNQERVKQAKRRLVVEALEELPVSVAAQVYKFCDEALQEAILEFVVEQDGNFDIYARKKIKQVVNDFSN